MQRKRIKQLGLIVGLAFSVQVNAAELESIEGLKGSLEQIQRKLSNSEAQAQQLVEGGTVRENFFDKRINERYLPRLENIILDSVDLLELAATKYPSFESQNLFNRSCGLILRGNATVNALQREAIKSNTYKPSEFDEVSYDLDDALELNGCRD